MNQEPALVIFIAAIFTGNILLSKFLGMCSFIACAGQIRTALGLGTAVTFVMTMTTMLNFALYHYVLVPLGIDHLRLIIFIAVIAAFVQFVEMFVERFSPKLYFALGIFLPLITVNCAILGASMFMVIRSYSFVQTVSFGLGSGIGWALAILLLAGLQQKMLYSNIPAPFRGVPAAMIVTCVLAMAFMGLAISGDQGSGSATTGGSCASGGCHSEIVDKEHVHSIVASGGCTSCHSLLSEEEHTWELASERDKLCDACHSGLKDGAHVHQVLKDGDCMQCHDPHGSGHKALLPTESVAGLCRTCHGSVEKAEFLHGPVAIGECSVCHNPHSADHARLLPSEPTELCYSCHETTQNEVKDLEFVHAPMQDGCLNCHDKHGASNAMLLRLKSPQLCYTCHEEIKASQEQAKSRHHFVSEPDGCVKCHTPHASSVKYGLKADPMTLCISCHENPIPTVDGKELGSFSEEIANKRFMHGPVSQKNCSGCHVSHGSNMYRLLTKEYPSQFYADFSLGNYELCFTCHSEKLVLATETSGLTDFRNGTQNLHFLHVNRDKKGRTCSSCHATHASDLPKRVRRTVPFGRWDMPIQFNKTETGGSCAPGCHAPYAYDRDNPASYDN